jgi:hypothetical protein
MSNGNNLEIIMGPFLRTVGQTLDNTTLKYAKCQSNNVLSLNCRAQILLARNREIGINKFWGCDRYFWLLQHACQQEI